MKGVRWIALIVCGAIIGLNVYNLNANRLMRNQMPMPFGYGLATVLSGSMEPEFSKGDLLLVQEVGKELQVNDIVVFQEGSSLIVHRIIEIQEDNIVTKGDANNVADDPISRDAVKGVVLGWVPYVGTVVEFMKTPVGIIVVIGAAILLMELPRITKKRQDDEELDHIKEEIRRLKEDMEK